MDYFKSFKLIECEIYDLAIIYSINHNQLLVSTSKQI